jgi:hypothetical protein
VGSGEWGNHSILTRASSGSGSSTNLWQHGQKQERSYLGSFQPLHLLQGAFLTHPVQGLLDLSLPFADFS